MDSFRTVVAVLVVLVAFTGFQAIANFSLRRAVRNDVKQQIESADSQMLRVQAQARKASELAEGALAEMTRQQARLAETAAQAEKLAQALGSLSADVATASGKAGDLAKSIKGLEANIQSLDAAIKELQSKVKGVGGTLDDASRKLGLLDGAANQLREMQASIKLLEQQVARTELTARSASQDAGAAVAESRRIAQELNGQKDALAAGLAQWRKDFLAVSTRLQKLSADIEALKPKDGGT